MLKKYITKKKLKSILEEFSIIYKIQEIVLKHHNIQKHQNLLLTIIKKDIFWKRNI